MTSIDRSTARAALGLATLWLLLAARTSFAFSMLAHQEIVDRAWEKQIEPLLERRFPGGTPDELKEARSYAYGGAVVADLGYFPFGDEFFSELIHYVRTGDFAESLLVSAHDRNGYAFALGHLAHYAADGVGHPRATNRAVAELLPKLAAEHGPSVTYADSASAHLQTEFRFDVLEVARLGFRHERFQDAIGFHLDRDVLADAVRRTYDLELEDLFDNVDLALGTFRFGVRTFLREVTNVGWHLYESDLKKQTPDLTFAEYSFDMPLEEFEKSFGTLYREPSYFARFVGALTALVHLIPGVRWFEREVFRPLPDGVIRLFAEGVDGASDRYRELLAQAARPHPAFPNVDLDTGQSTSRGEYALADEAYAEWLHRLAKKHYDGVTADQRRELLRFYRDL
jgi:hypothetical protein